MFCCKKAGKLLSESLDRKLSFFEKIQLKCHLMMCLLCRKVGKNMFCLHEMTRELSNKIEEGVPIGDGMSESCKQKLKEKIKTCCQEKDK